MPAKIAVLAKQVIDPEMPMAAFQIDSTSKRVVTPPNIPPVVNGFDENAVEAALQIKDSQEASVTVISAGSSFALDVMKKPLSMGADELVLLQDDAFENTVDSFQTAQLLTAAIQKLGGFDLIICGRQASDWDNAQVPLGVAELLGVSCVALGKKVDLQDDKVVVERLIPDGYEVVEASLPALVTVSNELGQPRYPTLRGDNGRHQEAPHHLECFRPGPGRGAGGAPPYPARPVRSREQHRVRNNRRRRRGRGGPQPGLAPSRGKVLLAPVQ